MNCHPCCWWRNPDSQESEELLLDPVESQKHYSESESPIPEDAETKSQDIRRDLLGYGLMVVAVVEVGFSMAFSQLLNRLVPESEINGFRFVVQLFITIAVATVGKRDLRIKKKNIGWSLVASISLLLTGYCGYGTTYYLPIGIASGVEKSSEILLFYLISFLIVRVLKVEHLLAVTICLAGILLVLQPSFIFHHQPASFIRNNTGYRSPCNRPGTETNSSFPAETINSTAIAEKRDRIIGYSLVYGGVAARTVLVFVTKYKLHDVDNIAFMFWGSLLDAIVSFVVMGITETPVFPGMDICAVFLFVNLLLAGTHNFCYVYAYKILPPTMSALLSTLEIPMNFVMQYTVLAGMYPGHANVLELSGAVVVFFGNLLVPGYETVQYMRLKNS